MPRASAPLFFSLLAGCATVGERGALERMLLPFDEGPVQVAALVVDLDSGATLVAREAKRLLRPASTMKVLTTAAVCRREADGAVETVLVADAVPEGAVTLIGGGDAFLSSDELRGLVRELVQQGLRRVRGAAVTVVDPLHAGDRFGEGWMWDDEPGAFMPPVSAAAVDGGCVTVEVRAAADGGMAARLLPVAGPFALDAAASDGPLRVTRGVYTDRERVTVRGHVDGQRAVRRRLSAPDPARYTASVLAGLLAEEGLLAGEPVCTVVASAPVFAAGAPRAVLHRPIADVVARTNKPSDNLGAELLLRRLGAPLDAGAAARGIAAVRDDLTALGFDPAQLRIADGSGVSHYGLLSAEVLVAELVDMHRRGGRAFAAFEASLPVAGRDGTLDDRMQGTAAAERVHAKTGTISGVSNLAGYVTTRSGRKLAFAILVQNFAGSAAPYRALQDAFCARLAAL